MFRSLVKLQSLKYKLGALILTEVTDTSTLKTDSYRIDMHLAFHKKTEEFAIVQRTQTSSTYDLMLWKVMLAKLT